jgi:hypothetical protein
VAHSLPVIYRVGRNLSRQPSRHGSESDHSDSLAREPFSAIGFYSIYRSAPSSRVSSSQPLSLRIRLSAEQKTETSTRRQTFAWSGRDVEFTGNAAAEYVTFLCELGNRALGLRRR